VGDETSFQFALTLSSELPSSIASNRPFTIEAELTDLQPEGPLPEKLKFKLSAYTTSLSPVLLNSSIPGTTIHPCKVEVEAGRSVRFSRVVVCGDDLPPSTELLIAITAKDSSFIRPFVSEPISLSRDVEPHKRLKTEES
jgi:hypothetical protein